MALLEESIDLETEEVIELSYDVQGKALGSYYSDNYFEAVQLMQLHLESTIRSLLFCCDPNREEKDFVHVQHVLHEVSLSQGAKCLYVFGVFDTE